MGATYFNSYSIVPGEELSSYRHASLCLSALLLRKWKEPGDKLVLVTDAASVDRLPSGLYDDVLLTTNDDGVDVKTFWAAVKLRGLRDIPAPVFSVDWDLFVLDKTLLEQARNTLAVGLHYECKAMAPYLHHAPMAGHPVNCGIVGFECPEAKKRYCGATFNFMRNFAGPTPGAMQVAEQGIFGSMFSDVLYQEGTNGFFSDSRCYHIWGNKIWLENGCPSVQQQQIDWTLATAKAFGLTIPPQCPR